MNLQRIKILAENKRYEFKALAKSIGMSEGNLHRCVRENKIQAQDLEKIAIELDVSISEFFDEKSDIRSAGRDYVEKGNIEHHGVEYNAPVEISENQKALEEENAELRKKLIAAQERIIDLMDKSKL